MAGIIGVYYLDSSEVDKNLLQEMTDTISHRGENGERFYSESNIGFGCRIQVVTGQMADSQQLFVDQDNSLVIVNDGHIYNLLEIRRELERAGYSFRTNSDTEVILYSYKQWGVDCLNRFNGMWAFAIWDTQKKELFCARDRFGIKPFYYYFDDNLFVFASEIKAILKHPRYPKKINDEAVYNYLMWGLFNYSEDTFFTNIKELYPSHFLKLNAEQVLKRERWWHLDFNCNSDNISANETDRSVEYFRALLEDAVKLRIESDEIIGITLSGGLDSSAITSIAGKLIHEKNTIPSQNIGDKLKILSSRYNNKSIDEGRFIDLVVQDLGAERFDVFCDGYTLWENFPKLIWHYDEPCDVGSIYARWSLMKKAKELGVRVFLNGDGGDEQLAGYPRFYGDYFIELVLNFKILKLLNEVKKASSVLGIRKLSSHVLTVFGGILYRKLSLKLPVILRNFRLRVRHRITDRIIVPSFDKQFYKLGLARINQEYYNPSGGLHQSLYRSMSRLARRLRFTDRSSAAFSIETRTPLLDYRLVEYSFNLPTGLKIRDGWTKWILRQSMQDILPEQVRLRKEKLGFPTPLRTWLLLNKGRIKELFCSGNVLSSQFINAKLIEDNLDELLRNDNSAQELWRYINLELWLQVFFKDSS
jgi:asparagine synthase (glutamine-hydrolysing)